MPRPIYRIHGERPSQRLADAVLAEIEEHGVDGVRVVRVAERMGVAIGTLYRHWGGREMCLEQTWRHVMSGLDQEVGLAITRLSPKWHAFDDVWECLRRSLPDRFDAFLELGSSRRRWLRGDQESDAVILPSLALYVDLAQHLGHVRLGEPHFIAALIWRAMSGTLAGAVKYDALKAQWCLAALKRMLFTPQAMEIEAEQFEVDVVDPDAADLPPDPW